MKDMDELENMTLFDITANEGVLTHLILGVSLTVIGIMYLFIDIYYKLKFKLRR